MNRKVTREHMTSDDRSAAHVCQIHRRTPEGASDKLPTLKFLNNINSSL
jgi:hypothetical protein